MPHKNNGNTFKTQTKKAALKQTYTQSDKKQSPSTWFWKQCVNYRLEEFWWGAPCKVTSHSSVPVISHC